MSAEVISTPELLEQILVHLPIRDLLVAAPLVSKTWHAVTLSPALQRALFFEPDPLASASTRVKNPLLAETFPPFFEDDPHWSGNLEAIESMPWSKAPDAFKRQEASWRRMLVTQPPAQTMVIEQEVSGMAGISERRAVLKDLSLRMGVLYDTIVPFIEDDVVCFRIQWHNGIALEGPGDLKLEVGAGYGCMDDLSRTLGGRFHSDGEKVIEVPFGKWETRMWD
ncbi:putative MFS transporter [Mycena sanguinolenta]|uniref:Putative MFS transporter n=1 Tax=Mycena sanguinolenta TaxID=230812 RepID=A0A8H7CQH6_9AGAR|nr:putative MFS transporter [Mycena sanguinolenta]